MSVLAKLLISILCHNDMLSYPKQYTTVRLFPWLHCFNVTRYIAVHTQFCSCAKYLYIYICVFEILHSLCILEHVVKMSKLCFQVPIRMPCVHVYTNEHVFLSTQSKSIWMVPLGNTTMLDKSGFQWLKASDDNTLRPRWSCTMLFREVASIVCIYPAYMFLLKWSLYNASIKKNFFYLTVVLKEIEYA